MRLRLDPGAQPACSERCDSSNGPAGKARASSVVSTLGSPLVTATSTATSSAWTERATDSVKAVSGEGGWAIKAPAGAGKTRIAAARSDPNYKPRARQWLLATVTTQGPARAHSGPKMNLMSMRAARHGGARCRSAHHAQAHDRSERRRRPPRRRTPPRVDPRTGTTVLPLASNSRMVAGMPRAAAPSRRRASPASSRPKKTCSTSTTNTAALERRDRRRPPAPAGAGRWLAAVAVVGRVPELAAVARRRARP